MSCPFPFKQFLFAGICVCGLLSAHAQSPERRPAPTPEEIQKMKTQIGEDLKKAGSDTAKVRLQMQLATLTGRENFDEAIKLAQTAITLAEKTGHVETIARSYFGAGKICQTNNRYDDALEYFNKGLPWAEKTGDVQIQQPYYNSLGTICERKGTYEKALDYYHKSYAALEKLPTPPGRLAGALMQIGQVQSRTGKFRESNESYRKALVFAEKALEWEKVSGIWYNIGNNYNELGDTTQAEAAFAKSREYRDRGKKKAPPPTNGKSGGN